MQIEVIIQDHIKDIATVKVVTPHDHERLRMARYGNKWVIVNTLREKNTPQWE